MKRIILKYPLRSVPVPQRVCMQKDANIICVHEQNGQIILWAEVPKKTEDGFCGEGLEFREFVVIPTGGYFDLACIFVGTAFVGQYVWHVYEVV